MVVVGAALGGPLEVKRVASDGERGILADVNVTAVIRRERCCRLLIKERGGREFQCFPPKLSWMHDAFAVRRLGISGSGSLKQRSHVLD